MRHYGSVYVKLLFMFLGAFSVSSVSGQVVKIGMTSDVHDETSRLQQFVTKAKTEKPDFIIQLGDLSSGKPESSGKMLTVWNSYPGKRYHVLGNHDMDKASKKDVIKRQEMPGGYYSFDCGPFHFVVLDCNYIFKDGRYVDYDYANYYIYKLNRDLFNPEHLDWLKKDLEKTDKKVILFSHETFDDIPIRGANPVPNRSLVRDLIREINKAYSGNDRKVIACFAGHDHLDHYNRIDGVHYFAVNSALGFKSGLEVKDALYSFVTLDAGKRTITIKGVQSEFLHNPTIEDYGHYPKKLIFPYIKDRFLNY